MKMKIRLLKVMLSNKKIPPYNHVTKSSFEIVRNPFTYLGIKPTFL